MAAKDWYDPGRRWLTVGTIEMVLRGTLLLTDLGSTNTLAKKYDIDLVLLRDTIKTKKGLYNPGLAKRDDFSPQFKSPEVSVSESPSSSSYRRKIYLTFPR